MAEYIERFKVLAEYDRQHEGAPGRARKIVEDFPAAEVVEVRHGRWEDTNKSVRCHNAYRFNWWCSECGEPQHTPVAKTLGEFTKENPFCHCCGAKMDGGVNRVDFDTVKNGGVNDAAD